MADLNRDGADDAVVYNPDVAAPDQVVYVLLGPLDSPDPVVHQRIDPTVIPFGVQVSDLDSDSCPDLIVYGQRKQNTSEGFLEIYLNGAGEGPTPLVSDAVGALTPLSPEGSGPVLIAAGVFEGDAVTDLALSDLSHLHLVDLTGDGAASLPSAPTRELFNAELSSINGLMPYPSRDDSTVDDLLIVEGQLTHWAEREATAGLSRRTGFNNGGTFTVRTLASLDLDGDGDDDVIGGTGQLIGGWIVNNDSGAAAEVQALEFSDTSIIVNEGLSEVSDLAAGELDGAAGPELVILDYQAGGGSSALLLQNVREMNDAIEPSMGTNLVFAAGFNPRIGLVLDADADADLDVYAIDPTTGEGRCFEVSGADLVACD